MKYKRWNKLSRKLKESNEIFREEKGIISVYLVIVMIVIILLIFILIDLIKVKYNDNKIRMAGIISSYSILAGYNRELWDKYGLLVIRDLDEYVIEDKIKKELEINIDSNDLSKIKVQDVTITNSNSLCDNDELENQIIEHMKSIGIENTFNFIKEFMKDEINKAEEYKKQEVDVLTEEEWKNKDILIEDRREENLKDTNSFINSENENDIIISEALLKTLPSNDVKNFKGIDNDYEIVINESKNLYKSVIKNMPLDDYINLYILNKFYSKISNDKNIDSFFNLEIEYIICGNKSENENFKSIKKKMVLLRLPVQLIKVYSDKELMSKLEVTAQVLTGWWGTPILATATKNALVCSIAIQNSKDDVKKMINGKKVELVANSNIYFSYEDYLHLLLLTIPKNDKLNRIKNLIYLNMNKINFQFLLEKAKTKIEVKICYFENLIFIDKIKLGKNVKFKNSNKEAIVCAGY